MVSFNKRLDSTVNPPKRKREDPTKGRRRVWWSRTHTVATVVLVAVLGVGGVQVHSWLDGRSITQGLSDALEASEKKNGDVKESEYDLGPAPTFATCVKLREVYPTGLAQTGNPRIYDANKRLDVNKNRFVCEDGE